MNGIRPAAVAGGFYAGTAADLARQVDDLVAAATPPSLDLDPVMFIVPHAGYVYSGPVAATAYRVLAGLEPRPRRVVLLGPAHFVGFTGVASSDARGFATPLGTVEVDPDVAAGTHPNAAAHAPEHSLEVQLPFLQRLLEDLAVMPLLTGDVDPAGAAATLEHALGWADVAIISSDLSHYLDYDTAALRDERTARAIVGLQSHDIARDDACGRVAVQASLLLAQRRGWQCRLLDLRSSGDTAGARDRVVGYGAFALGPVPVTR